MGSWEGCSAQEEHFGSLGGQEDGMGDGGQDRRALARARAVWGTTLVVSVKGERTANPLGKLFRKVRWRCELMSSASDRKPLALSSAKVAVMGL